MKSDFSFNSSSVPVSDSATVSGLSKPRLSKTRRPPGGPHSRFSKDSRVNPLNNPFGSDPVVVNLVSPGGVFSEKGEAFVSGVNRSDSRASLGKDVIDEMREMNIGREETMGFVFKAGSNTDFSTEEMKVADEMMKLNIRHTDNKSTANDNACLGVGVGHNVHSSIENFAQMVLPTEFKKLNVESTQVRDGGDLLFKAEEKKQSVFKSSTISSLLSAGSSETLLQGQMNKLNLKDSMKSSGIEKNVPVSDSSADTRFMFGDSTGTPDSSRDRTEEKLSDMIGDMKISGSRDPTGHSGRFSSFPFPGIYTKKTGSLNDVTLTDVGKSVPTGLAFETAMPVKGAFFQNSESISEPSATGKTDGFLFSTKQDGTDSVFNTPNTKGNVFSGPNQKSDLSGRRVAGSSIRSKKGRGQSGRQLNPVQVWLGPNISPGGSSSSQENSVSPIAYSPMDVSPYEEKLAGSLSRETSVASDDSFLVDESSDSFPTASNDAMDEDLAFATQRMNISEGAEKSDEEKQSRNVSSEFHEEDSLYSAETESFKSANEDLDSEASSLSSNIEEQGSDRVQFSSVSSQATSGNNFIFGSSSSGQGPVSARARQYKKKNWLNVGIDSSQTIPSVKSHYSSAPIQFPFSGASSLSSPRYSQTEVTSTLQHRRNEFEEIKHGSTTSTSSTAVAVQEACEKWRLRGNQAYSNGDLLKAEEYYTYGVNSVSRTETSRNCLRALMLCYSNRAATQMSLGRMREAVKDCMLAGAIDPNFVRVQLRAANCYLDLGEVEEALQYFQKCLIQGPNDCVDGKVMVEASEGIQKAQKVSECLNKYTDFLRLKTTTDAESALSIIAEAMTISPHSEKLLEMKAMALFLLRKYEEVIQLCEQSAVFAKVNFPPIGDDSFSSNSDSSVMLWRFNLIFKSYFYLGKLEEALGLLEKQDDLRNRSNTLESSVPLAITRKLLCHKAAGNEAFQSGRHTEAVEHYTAALSCTVESRPFAAICFCNRAAAYKALNQITDAIADCSLAIALDQKYLKALSRRASLYEMIRDYGQAANDLERLVSFLMKQVDDVSGDRSINIANDLRQARSRLSEVESEARKEIPLNMYLILGIDASVSASEIKKAYRKAALKHHPDKAGYSLAKSDNGEDGLWREIAEEVRKDTDRLFKMIGEAYAVLSNPNERKQYDLEEEARTSQKISNVTSTSRVHTDAQYYPSERTGSRPNWMGERKSYWHS